MINSAKTQNGAKTPNAKGGIKMEQEKIVATGELEGGDDWNYLAGTLYNFAHEVADDEVERDELACIYEDLTGIVYDYTTDPNIDIGYFFADETVNLTFKGFTYAELEAREKIVEDYANKVFADIYYLRTEIQLAEEDAYNGGI